MVEEMLSSLNSSPSSRATPPHTPATMKSNHCAPNSSAKKAADSMLASRLSHSGCGPVRLISSSFAQPSSSVSRPEVMPREMSLTRATHPRFVVRTLVRITSLCGTPCSSTKE